MSSRSAKNWDDSGTLANHLHMAMKSKMVSPALDMNVQDNNVCLTARVFSSVHIYDCLGNFKTFWYEQSYELSNKWGRWGGRGQSQL